MLICWNDIKIHLGFEDSYFVPPLIIMCGICKQDAKLLWSLAPGSGIFFKVRRTLIAMLFIST